MTIWALCGYCGNTLENCQCESKNTNGKAKGMKEYRIQRPAQTWVETTVKAETLEAALEIADARFTDGDYQEAADSFAIDDYQFWAQDETGEEYTQADYKAAANA